MIRQLRGVHRLWWPIAGLAMAALIIAGVFLKQSPQITPVIRSTAAEKNLAELQFEAQTAQGVTTASVRAFSRDNHIFLELTVAAPLKKPDILVYWQTDGSPDLQNAWLLGGLGGGPRSFPLPHGQVKGKLVLFSLAHGESPGNIDLNLGGLL